MGDSVNTVWLEAGIRDLETQAEALRQNYLLACAGQAPASDTSPTAQYLHQRLLAAALAYAEAANRVAEARQH